MTAEEIKNNIDKKTFEFRIWDKEFKKMLSADNIPDNRERYSIIQFTGIIDTNGKKIFDGDIVSCHKFTKELGDNLGVTEGEKEFIAVINFEPYGGVQVILDNGAFMFVWEYEEGWHEESLEVIGNVFENPELWERQ